MLYHYWLRCSHDARQDRYKDSDNFQKIKGAINGYSPEISSLKNREKKY